jgi:hypothetical protein
MPDSPRSHRQPSLRRLFAITVAAAVVGFILTLSFGFADHAPAPHGVRIAVAAPAGIAAELTTGLAHAAPGGFTVVAAPSARAVTDRVRSQSAAGGLVIGATGPVTIVTAAAAQRRDRAAARDVVYFPGSSLGHPLLALGIWLAGSLAVLVGVDRLHLAERRRAPEREAEIYATSGTVHLRQRLARRRPAALETADWA